MLEFDEEMKKLDGGADHIIDFVGRNYFQQNLEVLKRDGMVVYLAMLSGSTLPEGGSLHWRSTRVDSWQEPILGL